MKSPTRFFRACALFPCLVAPVLLVRPAAGQSGPSTNREQVAEALKDTPEIPKGPFAPTWESLQANYRTPEWFKDAKFGIMMHWGLYAVPAHGSEWYEMHMYNNAGIRSWHIEHFGPVDKFGYKDFIPLFTAAKFDPDAWAALFKKAGAKYIIPTAEHHDGFSLWDSAYNKWNAKTMGPKRDLIADLGAAVRKAGLKYGVSNHSIEHFNFIVRQLPADIRADLTGKKTDLFDPAWVDFYSVVDQSPEATVKFLHTWVLKNYELIDKYHPDILWFDNGVNGRVFDPLKLAVAAYYYNRAAEWGKQVSLSTKGEGRGAAYLYGTITDYEREGRAPKEMTAYAWEVDDPVLYRFGYTEGSTIVNARGVVRNLVENVCRNGNLLLNISPKADGTIPDDQQSLLLGIGKWLDQNGEAIYGTRPWKIYGEGTVRYTTKNDALYALLMAWPDDNQAVIPSLATGAANLPAGKIEKIELLGHAGNLEFAQDKDGLKVKLPAEKPGDYVYALKITGLKPLQPSTPPAPATPAAQP